MKNSRQHVLIALAGSWRRYRLLYLVSMMLGLLLYGVVLQQEVERTRRQAHSTVQVRAQQLASYITFYGLYTDAMADSVRSSYLLSLVQGAAHPALARLRDYPSLQVYGISGFADEGGAPELPGSLSGIGSAAVLDPALRAEIVASLSLDGQLQALTAGPHVLEWAYYTSARNFIYLAPKARLRDVRIRRDFYKQQFWTQAVPAANPTGRQIITDLYDDAAGKGLMITLSTPVLLNNKLLGVASVDFTTVTLQKLAQIGEAAGESLLVDEHLFLVAGARAIKVRDKLDLDRSKLGTGWRRIGGDWWLQAQVKPGELTLLHRLPILDSYLAAVAKTAHVALLLLALGFSCHLLLALRTALAQLVELNSKDSLTGLLNRPGFTEHAGQMIALSAREQRSWCVLMLDIDHFKQVNDRFNHDVGDQVIRAIAGVMKACLRASDHAGRWGGEEFVVYLYDTDLAKGALLAERLRDEVSQRIRLPNGERVTVSVGVALGAGNTTLEEVIKQADKELYAAKRGGRNRVCYALPQAIPAADQ